MSSSILLILGIIFVAISIIGFSVFRVVLQKSSFQLQEKLNEEYGKRKNNLRE